MASRVHFLTGDQTAIDQLCDAIGFTYSFDAKSGQFAHPGMVTLLTPTGTIARYFFGINLQPRDLRLGLVEASEGKISSAIDSFMLYCLYYDPDGATYAASVLRLVRLAGLITIIGMGLGLVWAWRRERRPRPNAVTTEEDDEYLADTKLDLRAASERREERK
jgi:protein SCO1/2